MTLYMGVDIHARQQTVSYMDTEDGVMEQRELHHEGDVIREFYSQFRGQVIIGIEACGNTNWFSLGRYTRSPSTTNGSLLERTIFSNCLAEGFS